jgi:type II secretory pathway component PulJ
MKKAMETIMDTHDPEAGFALTDVLVGLALTAMAITLLVSTYPVIRRAITRATVQSQLLEDDRALKFAADLIGRAVHSVEIREGNSGVLQFMGTPSQLSLVADMPGRGMVGGLYASDFVIENADGGPGKQLVLLSRVHGRPAKSSRQSTRVLISHLRSIRFRYFGPAAPHQGAWLDTWVDQDRLPKLVAIEFESNAGRPGIQTLVVHLQLRP